MQDQGRDQEEKDSPFPPNIYDYKLDANFDSDNLPYKTYLNFSKLYLGSDIDYERPIELSDAYKGLRASLRNGISLDRRLQNPDYLRPLRTKQNRFNSSLDSGHPTRRGPPGKLSAFNADKRMAGVKLLTDGVSQKMRLPPVHPGQPA